MPDDNKPVAPPPPPPTSPPPRPLPAESVEKSLSPRPVAARDVEFGEGGGTSTATVPLEKKG